MPKLLVAVKSCVYDLKRGAHSLVREMWGRQIKDADVRFFTAGQGQPEHDEVIVDAPDDYPNLPYKTREIVRWALKGDYEHIFLCDTGSFVFVHHLENYDYSADYIGYWGLKMEPFDYVAQNKIRHCQTVRIQRCYPWASGGGYFLSRKAMEIVAAQQPIVWAEDLNVGQALAAQGIFLTDRSHAGFKGHIVNWIHNEDNTNNLDKRRLWMASLRKQAMACALSGTCEFYKKPQTRIEQPPDFSSIRKAKVTLTPWDRSTR